MNSKICIVSTSNIKHMTLISMYTKILEDKGINYDLIYFDRYDIVENTNAKKTYKFTSKIYKKMRKYQKAIQFLKFSKFAKKILNENKYDLVIVWNTLTALLLSKYLLNNSGKYVLNIRDYFYEKNNIIFKWHKKLINGALFTTISSRGFENFLPTENYLFVNSFNEKMLKNIRPLKRKQDEDLINIGFLGNIRFYAQQIKLIEALKNDPRIMLWYCGTNYEELQRYVIEHNINNCIFTGQFSPDETELYLEKFDMINNIFGNDNMAVTTLTSIRLYYTMLFKIPILVNNNTHMSKIVEEYDIGLSIDIDSDSFKNQIIEYFEAIDRNAFEVNTMRFRQNVEKENLEFKNRFNEILSEMYEKSK